ncbi:hypothetical protein ABZ904_42570 [Streptomyces sp. NPDC046900]|uniref:hypothetical protein n=1 Tax=Streptomyces sp. NPDC046900 TaxID=3155473 RepID=UPI0033E6682E
MTSSDLADPEPVRADAVEPRDIVAEQGTLTTLATAVGQEIERTKMQMLGDDLQPHGGVTQRSAHDGLSHCAAAAGSPSAELSAVVRSRCRIRDVGGAASGARRRFLPGDVARPGQPPLCPAALRL